MSAFVLHDMLEHVQAHATYRFVLSDEEDERPRLLVSLHLMASRSRELTGHGIDLAIQASDADIIYASSTNPASQERYG
jgi:hypothetical protein